MSTLSPLPERGHYTTYIYKGGYSNTHTRAKKGIKLNDINEILYD